MIDRSEVVLYMVKIIPMHNFSEKKRDFKIGYYLLSS